MNLKNKIFRNNKTGEVIKVIDSFENIAILESKEKVDVNKLMNSDFFTEQIDPKNFFNNQSAYNILAEKIKNIPTSQIKDEEDEDIISKINVSDNFGLNSISPATNESAIVMTTEEDERAELARKYGALNDNTNAVSKQNEAFARILGDDAEDELPSIVKSNNQNISQPIQQVQVQRETPNKNTLTNSMPLQAEDPIITMFKKTKRNVDFSIQLDINDKIPRVDFIEMMEDSYEISMIDFLADEFTNKIIENPDIIKSKIKDKIKEIVYGKTKDVNPQITDSVTQKFEPLTIEKEPVLAKDLPKKVSTRKPRTKKETTEK